MEKKHHPHNNLVAPLSFFNAFTRKKQMNKKKRKCDLCWHLIFLFFSFLVMCLLGSKNLTTKFIQEMDKMVFCYKLIWDAICLEHFDDNYVYFPSSSSSFHFIPLLQLKQIIRKYTTISQTRPQYTHPLKNGLTSTMSYKLTHWIQHTVLIYGVNAT